MRVWTVLSTEKEYEQLMKTGYLVTDHLDPECMANTDLQFSCSYDWLSKKLREKTSSWKYFIYRWYYSISKLVYPRWVWYQVEGSKNPLDIDITFWSHRSGQYRFIFFDIDPNLILLSDYDLWHYCLNNWYLCNNEGEELQWEKYIEQFDIDIFKLKDINYLDSLTKEQSNNAKIIQQKIIGSWDNIFDLTNEDEFVHCKNNEKTIQGVTWVLRKKDITFIKPFTITQDDIDRYEKQFE